VPPGLRFTNKALADLDAIASWLTQPGAGSTARRRLTGELPRSGGYRALYRVTPDTGRDETAGDVRVLRVFGPGQSRGSL
jgi:plasmid stabilization system protein ParE